MADALQRLIQLCPFALVGEQSAAWGANVADGRSQIRRSIGTNLSIPAPVDLSGPPRDADWSISISHTPNLGAWVAARRPLRVGFDVEQSARLNARIIARIATPAEIAAAPNLNFVWGAKEAVFKAGADTVQTIGQIDLLNWRTCEAGAWTFYGHHGQGWLLETAERIYALYVVPK